MDALNRDIARVLIASDILAKRVAEMGEELNEAYRTLMSYCAGFEYSFRREDIQNFQDGEDFWWEHFGEF